MQKTVRFFKLDNEWYADVPGHTLEENEMISGADTVLEEIDRIKSGTGEVFLILAEKYGAVGFEVWICNVTHDVLGEHPESIYVLDIK